MDIIGIKKHKKQAMKKQEKTDVEMFNVKQHKCWMFPCNETDRRNAEELRLREEAKAAKAAQYPASNAKEVTI